MSTNSAENDRLPEPFVVTAKGHHIHVEFHESMVATADCTDCGIGVRVGVNGFGGIPASNLITAFVDEHAKTKVGTTR